MAGLVSGDAARRQARQPPDFVERPWAEIQATLTGPVDAPHSSAAPADPRRAASAGRAGASGRRPSRPRSPGSTDDAPTLTITHPRVGTSALVQAGEWIVAHTIRHNAQMKRALGR